MQQKLWKQWLIVLSLCMLMSNLAQAQTVQKIEYFFDTDPGYGNATAVTTIPAMSIDSTFTFAVSSLSYGLHRLHVRSQDNAGRWSLTYSNSFIKTTGPDGTLAIVRLEYFIDTDPGYGNGMPLTIQTGAEINDSFAIPVPDNGANSRYVAVRAMDSKGQWSMLYDYNVNLCDLYRAKPSFSWIQYGDQFSFIDSSANNPSHQLMWKFGNLGTDSVSNPQFSFPKGNFTATLVAGTGCRKDSVTRPLFVGLEQYYPDSAIAGGKFAMSFFGGGMDTSITVTLTNGSQTLVPEDKIGKDQVLLLSLFDIHTVTPGLYNVNLHFPGGYDTTIVNGVRILPAPAGTNGGANYEPDINISLIGPDIARPGSTVRVDMVVSNNGGMMAEQVPVTYTLSKDGTGMTSGYSSSLQYVPPPAPVFDYEGNIPHYIGLDSLFGKPYSGRLQNFIIPYLNAGESFTMPIYVTMPGEGGRIEIVSWPGQRILGSPLRGVWGGCIDAAVDATLGFIPVAGCVNGLYNYFKFGSSGVGEWAWNTFGTIVSCVPGVGQIQALAKYDKVLTIIEHPKAFTDIAHNTISGVNSANGACEDVNDPNKKQRKVTKKGISADPNEISGPNGYGTAGYFSGTGKYGYRVSFENLPTATANAQRVYIADTLDKNKFDLSTFELINYAVGDSFYTIPLQRKQYTHTSDLNAVGLKLRFNAKLDTATGILRFTFLSVDPLTRDTLSLSDIRGFLPPDLDGVSGRGAVSYAVKLKKNLPTFTTVTAKASIVFDNNAPIYTNTWLNTIDKIAPVGTVTAGTLVNDTTVRLQLGGADQGVGIERYTLYVSQNSGPYLKVGPIMGDTVRFTGAKDSSYRFYAIAYDSINNVAPKAPTVEYSIVFGSVLPVTVLSFSVAKQTPHVTINWKTTDETNFSRFEVERSVDGNIFEKIGTVVSQSGSGVKTYQLLDQNALTIFSSKKILYYRLKMIDIDTKVQYGRIAKVELDKKYTVNIFPNPAKNQLTVEGIDHYKSFTISDITGKLVIDARVQSGRNVIDISILQNGLYIINLRGDDDNRSLKFIKQE